MYCKHCAAKIPDGSVFCPECGQKLTSEQSAQQPQQQPVQQQPQPQYRQQPQAPQPTYAQAPVNQPSYQAPPAQPSYMQPQYQQAPMQTRGVPQGQAQPAYGSDLSAPLSTGSFFWMPLVVAIPIVGLILLFVWAFSKSTNLNRRNFARAMLIWALIGVIASVISILLGGSLLGGLAGAFSSF